MNTASKSSLCGQWLYTFICIRFELLNYRPSFIDFMKRKYPHFKQLDSLEKLKIILNPDKEMLPSVCNFIKRSLEVWGSRWSNHIKHNIVFIKQWYKLYLFIYTMSVYVCMYMYCYTQKGFICNKDYII